MEARIIVTLLFLLNCRSESFCVYLHIFVCILANFLLVTYSNPLKHFSPFLILPKKLISSLQLNYFICNYAHCSTGFKLLQVSFFLTNFTPVFAKNIYICIYQLPYLIKILLVQKFKLFMILLRTGFYSFFFVLLLLLPLKKHHLTASSILATSLYQICFLHSVVGKVYFTM